MSDRNYRLVLACLVLADDLVRLATALVNVVFNYLPYGTALGPSLRD